MATDRLADRSTQQRDRNLADQHREWSRPSRTKRGRAVALRAARTSVSLPSQRIKMSGSFGPQWQMLSQFSMMFQF